MLSNRATLLWGLVAGTLVGALGAASAEDAAASDATWITVSADGLAHEGAAGTATLTLLVDGAEAATSQETFTAGTHPLAGLVAKAPFSTTDAPRAIEIALAWDGVTAARLVGTLSESAEGLTLSVSRAEFDTASPIVATGEDAFSIVKGWSDATITIALAWDEASDGPAAVRLESDAPGATPLVVNAVAAGDGAWTAVFTVERVPDVLSWKATVERAGAVLGTTGATVAFATQTVSDASFTAAPASGLAAAGGFHELTTRSERVGVPASLFGASLAASPDCATGGVFGSMGGAAWRIAGLAGGASPCGEDSSAAASASPSRASEGGFVAYVTENLALVAAVTFGVLALGGGAWGAWQYAHRKRSFATRHH